MSFNWTDAELNAQADAEAARCPFVSIHTAAAGSSGASEAAGGSPAYARKASGFNAAGVEGPLGASQPATPGVAWGSATFDLPAGDFVEWGLWSAVSGGVFRGSGPLPGATVSAPYTLAGQGSVAVSVAVGPGV